MRLPLELELRTPQRSSESSRAPLQTASSGVQSSSGNVDFSNGPTEGFGFSDTAFRIFVLMASRRLNSDRFFTEDYTPEVYTQAGLDWIDDNDMSTVLLRHYPD